MLVRRHAIRFREEFVQSVRSGSPIFSKPMSFGIEGPKTSRSRTPTLDRGRAVASANARLTTTDE